MYEIILPLHVLFGITSIISVFTSLLETKISTKLFYGGLAGVSMSGVYLIVIGSSTLWVCVRLVSILLAVVALKVIFSPKLEHSKN